MYKTSIFKIGDPSKKVLKQEILWYCSIVNDIETGGDDIEAFLMTFERAVQAHGVERDKREVILAPQLTGNAHLAYAAMTDKDNRDYERVKAAIFQI